jgi:hypothetical protein
MKKPETLSYNERAKEIEKLRRLLKSLVDDCFSKQQWSTKKPTMLVYKKARKYFD